MSYPYYYCDADGIKTVEKLLFLVKMEISYGVGKTEYDYKLIIAESNEQAVQFVKDDWCGDEFGEILMWVTAESPLSALPKGFNNAK